MENAQRPLGVHISVLQDLFEKIPEEMRPGSTVEQLFALVIEPATKARACSYLDLVASDDAPEQAKPRVAPATCYVVHTWRSAYAAVLDCVQQYDQKHPDTYFWLDLVCNNHHTPQELPLEWWTTTLRQNLRAIGHVMFVITPLSRPHLLSRAWCVFEMLTAICMNLPFSFVVATAEHEHFKEKILTGEPHTALALLESIGLFDSRQTGTRTPTHSTSIGQAVSTLAGAFGTFTQTVKNTLQRWAVQLVVDVAMETSSFERVEALKTLAHVLDEMAGERAGAMVVYERCLQLRLSHSGEKTLEVAKLHLILGQLLKSVDQDDKAVVHINSALVIQQSLLGEAHRDLAWSHLALVDLYEKKKEGGEGLVIEHASKALPLIRASLGEYNPTTAGILNALGNAHLRLGDTHRALQYFESEIAIRKVIDVPTYSTLARVYEQRKDFSTALRFYEKDLQVKLDTYGDQCVLTQVAYLNLSHVHQLMNNATQAQVCLEHSRRIKEAGALPPTEARAATARVRVWRLTCLVTLWCLVPAVLLKS